MGKREITPKQKKSILKLFFRTKLRDGEETIDNMDVTIARELNMPLSMVEHTIRKHLDKIIPE